jgi:hypothetical protein
MCTLMLIIVTKLPPWLENQKLILKWNSKYIYIYIYIYMLMKQSLSLFSPMGNLIFFLIINGRLTFIISYLLGDEATRIS